MLKLATERLKPNHLQPYRREQQQSGALLIGSRTRLRQESARTLGLPLQGTPPRRDVLLTASERCPNLARMSDTALGLMSEPYQRELCQFTYSPGRYAR